MALNDLAHGRGPAPVVVTCRDDRYAALAARGYHLRDAAWIALQPVSARKVVDYLRQRAADGRWEPVLTALTSEGRITPEQAHRWLHELAAYLNTPTPGAGGAPGTGRTDLVLHHLWPIAGLRKARYTMP
ncbi:hypothetical protein ACFYWY_36365 [Streptomyces sp. NPDC002870]|uniref:hypothetical protein n=1 Tax=Streptomyces sp. NPDC002870 TaxID=3364666 RepID=UPI0036CA2BDA